MNKLASHCLTRGDLTRDALLRTAMTAFAEAGYDQVSLRALAIRAGVNQSLIGYHFGHKRGLYQAVFVAIAGRVRARLDPEMTLVEAALHDSAPGVHGREDDFRALFRLTDGLLDLMTDPGTDAWAQLIIREQQLPTEAFDLLYSGFMDRLLTLIVRLIGRLRGSMPEPEARLLALTVLGQILVFRAARAGVLRALAWSDIDAGAVEAIRARLHGNLRALLAASGS
ncbi:CerR family C-terminal domain-containing protein [Salinisphaera sp. RV14]|uniref:CerR family C-terminal domain-containing protein n=1 Tax=unclassified Salinisphaera TaxID=2649847 RepID=UPI003F82851E